jgi:hypothetical protein
MMHDFHMRIILICIYLMRVILIYATGYLYSSSNPMLWLYTVVWGGGGSRAV